MKKPIDILFVINPVSGGKNDQDLEEAISRFLRSSGLQWEILHTEGSGDPSRIRRALEKYQPKKVVAAGGDGTVNMVAAQLIHAPRPLGILPAGSANGLAYNLDIPRDVEHGLRRIIEGKEKSIDVLQINDTLLCLHLADIGLNARVVKRFEEEGSKGLAGYALQLMKELFSRQVTLRLTIENQGGKATRKVKMLVIANANNYGTGAQINPKGAIDDGKFELVLIKPYPVWYMGKMLLASLSGQLDKMRHVEILSSHENTITFSQTTDMHVDGEVVENIKTLKVAVLEGALRVIT